MKIFVWRAKTLLILCAIFLCVILLGVGYGVRNASPTFSPWINARTLVLDAGHGGFDGGAIGANGTTEQHTNLSIARRAQALAGFFGIAGVLTREDENALNYNAGHTVRDNKISDIKRREAITNDTPNAVFISIHLNKFEDSQYHGAQVFYSKNAAESKSLAEMMQLDLVRGLDETNHRQAKAAADTIYLMKKLTCPAIIVECGFLSNPKEEQLLLQEAYHKRIALCIISGYLHHEAQNTM